MSGETQSTTALAEGSSDEAAHLKAEQQGDARALKALMRPVAPQLAIGRLLAAVSGVLAVVPYIALVNIGQLLLDAADSGSGVDRAGVSRWLGVLMAAFTLRLFTYFVALLITHFADIKLGHLIRKRMVGGSRAYRSSGSHPPTQAASAKRCKTTSVPSTT